MRHVALLKPESPRAKMSTEPRFLPQSCRQGEGYRPAGCGAVVLAVDAAAAPRDAVHEEMLEETDINAMGGTAP